MRGTIIRVQVERVPARTRPPKVLWLWWTGPGSADLDLAWRAYIRRFDLEHTVRFAKQCLGWTTPRPRHPQQAERWTWLQPLLPSGPTRGCSSGCGNCCWKNFGEAGRLDWSRVSVDSFSLREERL